MISAHRRWFNVLIEQHGRGVGAGRFLVILCLMFVGADLCSAQSTSISSGRSPAVVVRWTALGAGAGFGLGAYLGVAFFDDAVNSDRKLWTSAIIGGVAGGVGGYLVGRHRDRNRSSAAAPLAAPARVTALPAGIPGDQPQWLRGTRSLRFSMPLRAIPSDAGLVGLRPVPPGQR